MSTSKIIRFVGALLLLMGVGYATFAQRPKRGIPTRPARWELLGQATVQGKADFDSIKVGRAEGRFQALQLRVTGGPVEFHRVIVHFANGQKDELEVREKIPAGGQTRAIDLKGNERAISSVDFFYGKGTWLPTRRPKVSLYGR
jgi:hypothetical protein